MAIKFNTISQIEKKYAFEDAIASADVLNGDFGAVTGGAFAVGATATKAIMQDENGDNAGLDEYPIKKGEHVRVVDLSAYNGETIEIYGAQLPDSYKKGDKLASDTNGKLVSGASSAPYFEITKVLPNVKGVEATVVVK